MCSETKKDHTANQQAEGKTHSNRLSCETELHISGLLCLPEALFPQISYLEYSPITAYAIKTKASVG